jgi:hypothetical protein
MQKGQNLSLQSPGNCEKIGMRGRARISSRFYDCGLLEGKGYQTVTGNEYN